MATKASKTAKTTTAASRGTAAPPTTVTLRFRRTIQAPAERIYRCFLDPDALAKWIPPHGFIGHVHHMDARVGGSYRMSFSTINRSWTQAFGGRYLELVPGKRIVHTDQFEGDDPNFPSGPEMKVTIAMAPAGGGTELSIVQENVPEGPAAEGAPEGWRQSLDNLQRLCEQEVPF